MAGNKSQAEPPALTKTIPMRRLQAAHIWLTVIYAVQAISLLLLSTAQSYAVHIPYVTTNVLASESTGRTVLATASHQLFELNLAHVLVSVLCVAAIAHGLTASAYRRPYESALKKGANSFRWILFGLIAGLLFVVIGMVSGIVDGLVLALLLALGVIMGFGQAAFEQSITNVRSRPSWLSCLSGYGAGVAACGVLTAAIWAGSVFGVADSLPRTAYGLFATLLVYLACITAMQYVWYKKSGPWQQYAYGERAYAILTAVALTVFVWQVYAGILRP